MPRRVQDTNFKIAQWQGFTFANQPAKGAAIRFHIVGFEQCAKHALHMRNL